MTLNFWDGIEEVKGDKAQGPAGGRDHNARDVNTFSAIRSFVCSLNIGPCRLMRVYARTRICDVAWPSTARDHGKGEGSSQSWLVSDHFHEIAVGSCYYYP